MTVPDAGVSHGQPRFPAVEQPLASLASEAAAQPVGTPASLLKRRRQLSALGACYLVLNSTLPVLILKFPLEYSVGRASTWFPLYFSTCRI